MNPGNKWSVHCIQAPVLELVSVQGRCAINLTNCCKRAPTDDAKAVSVENYQPGLTYSAHHVYVCKLECRELKSQFEEQQQLTE